MVKLLFAAFAACALFLAGCSSAGDREDPRTLYEPSETEKLQPKEKFELYDYARGFLMSSKKLKSRFAKEDFDFISKHDPDTRIHYTAPKTGKMFLSWTIPGRRQIVVSAEGYLVISQGNKAVWALRVSDFSRTGSQDLSKYGISE